MARHDGLIRDRFVQQLIYVRRTIREINIFVKLKSRLPGFSGVKAKKFDDKMPEL